MNEYFQKKNKQEMKIPASGTVGHFYLLDENVIPYAFNAKNQIPMTISTVGKGRLAFIATEDLVNPAYYPDLKDFFQDVYDKPVASPISLTKKYLTSIKLNNKSASELSRPYIWNAHYELGKDFANMLLEFIELGLRVIIGLKPWAYDSYVSKLLSSELKALFIAAGIWPSTSYSNNNWRTVTKASEHTMSLYNKIEYAKVSSKIMDSVSDSIGELFGKVTIEDIIRKETFDLINNRINKLYLDYWPYIKSLTPCWDGVISEKSDKAFIRYFAKILVSSFGTNLMPPALSIYPGKFHSTDPPFVDLKMKLNLLYYNEIFYLGLYLYPRLEASVKIVKSKSNICYIYVNYHHFDVSTKSEMWKWPITYTYFSIERNKLRTISFPFGGLLAMSCNNNNDKVEIIFKNVIQIPFYDRRNKEGAKDWIHKQRLISPWAILAGDTAVFVLSSNAIRNLADPDKTLRLYDSMFKEEFHLKGAGFPLIRRDMVSADIQIGAGYMHSGYPIGTQIYYVTNPSMTDSYFFNEAYLKIHGNWGMVHELGHNLQGGHFTFEGTGEVTNNIFSMVATESLTKKSSWSPTEGWFPERLSITDVIEYLINGTFDKNWRDNHFMALSIYAQLRSVFEWEFYAQLFRRYTVLDTEIKRISDDEKIQLWINVTSRIAGMNLCPLYEFWNWPISNQTEKELSKLPMFLPDDFLTKKVEKKVNKIISKFSKKGSVYRKPLPIPKIVGPLKNMHAIEGAEIIDQIQILN